MKYQRILKAMSSMPWMIQPEKLEAFAELVMLRAEGGMLSPEEVAERTEHPRQGEDHDVVLYSVQISPDLYANAIRKGWMSSSEIETEKSSRAVDGDVEASDARNGSQGQQSRQNVAVLPIYGVIMHRPSMQVSSGGGFNIQRFRSQFRAAVENPNISGIVLDVDSPGGSVDGVEEISREIYQARKQKRVVAVANTLAASAAYYIATAAEELAVTPSGEVGSIGVYMLHQDMSSAYEQQGIKNTLIKAGKYKAEGNPWMGLDDDAKASLQNQIEAHYDMFVKAVGRNRNVSVDTVRNGFGEGRTVMAKEAVKLGMADKVATLDEVLKSFGARGARKTALSGEAETPDIEAASEGEGLDAVLRQRELDMF